MIDTLGRRYHHCMPGRIRSPLGMFLSAAALVSTAAAPVRAQQIQVAPDANTVFTFSGFEGGPFLPNTLTTWKLDNADPGDAAFTVTSNQSWLQVAPADGNVGGLFTSNIDIEASLNAAEAANLAPGLYSATVSFNNLTNGDGNTTRTVRLTVAPANFSVTPSFISATATLNGPNPAEVVVTLQSNGQPVLNYELGWTARSWFSVDRAGGTVPGSGSDSFKVSFSIAGLDPGTYTSQIDVTNTTNGAGTRQLPVSLTVKSKGAGAITLLPNEDIEVRGPVGDLPPMTQRSTIVNDGEKSVTWNAVLDAPWVSVTPSAGELAGADGLAGGLDERNIDIRVNVAAQSLPAGSSTATVTFQTTIINLITGTTTGIAFGTRVVHVVADPVLALSMPAVGGKITTDPPGTLVDPATSTTKRLSFDFGEVVVVTATPGDGYEFRGWAGDFPEDAQTTNPIILPMDASKNLGALIAPILRELSLSTVGGGSGTIDMAPTGVEIENALTARYTNGTNVTLTAAPDAGAVFRGWSGNVPPGEELSNPLTMMMDRERVISARFEPAVSLDINVIGGGSVTVNPDLPAYAAGMTLILTAVPDESFVFSNWSGDATASDNPLTLTLGGGTSIIATFVAGSDSGGGGSGGDGNTAKLFVDILGDGVVTPGGGTYVKGATVTVIATPGLNSTFVRWEQAATGSDLVTTVIMNADQTVRAIFEPVNDSGGRPNPGGSGPGTIPACGAVGFLALPMLLLGWATLAGWTRRR
ncbi:MAG: hypothetical protein Q7R41_08435 [Phycisphaerales bacterium]|nr:hypothetical protein [Phycisphaerales bacterium]